MKYWLKGRINDDDVVDVDDDDDYVVDDDDDVVDDDGDDDDDVDDDGDDDGTFVVRHYNCLKSHYKKDFHWFWSFCFKKFHWFRIYSKKGPHRLRIYCYRWHYWLQPIVRNDLICFCIFNVFCDRICDHWLEYSCFRNISTMFELCCEFLLQHILLNTELWGRVEVSSTE